MLEAIARPQIEATLGGEVRIGNIRWLSFNQIEVSDLVGQAPGWNGPAGEVIRVDRAILEIDSKALRSGRFDVTTVEVMGMRIRMAERREKPGTFNFESLRPASGDGGIGLPPARIKVVDFELEMGSESDGRWERTGMVDLSGSLDADEENPRTLFFQFLTGSMALNKAVLKGSFDTENLEFNGAIADLDINQNLIGMLPMELRKATDSMKLEGSVTRITASWDGDDSVSASVDLGNARMIVPEKLESSWSRLDAGLITPVTEPPLVQVYSGRLELVGNRITLSDFVGSMSDQLEGADSIPVEIGFQMDLAEGLEAIQNWEDPRSALESAFEIAPFSLAIDVPDFRIDPSSNGVVLPTAAASAFSEFGIESWLVNVAIEMTREGPTRSSPDTEPVPAELLTSGTVTVQDGVGRYSRFPYPLEDVKALITFTDELVEIEYLIGRGIGGGNVVVKGSITKPGPAAGIIVNIKGTDVPGDKVFRTALDGWRRRIWDRFFDMHAENRMAREGLLNTESDVEKAIEERAMLYEQLGELPGEASTEQEKIIQKIIRRDRIIEAGPFRMGGLFSFDLTVSSEEGEGKPVFLTGDIDILEGDVLISDFPFPMHLLNSRITLEPDDILLNSGLTFTTPDGGSGIIRGSIHNPETEEGQDPQAFIDVEFSARDVAVSPSLMAALPPSTSDSPTDPGDWPGRWQSQAARAMAALGLEGRIDLDGTLRGDEEDFESDPILEFTAKMKSGTIEPDEDLSDFFAELGFVWPAGFQLHSCEAMIDFDSEKVEMMSFRGERGQGKVDARGYISRQSDAAGLEVSFVTIEMEEYLLDFIPTGPRSRVRELWSKFKPRGNFDADLSWHQDDDGQSDSVVVVEPESITLEMEGEDVDLHRTSGRIYIRPTLITVEDLETEFRNSRMVHGIMALDGSYGDLKDSNGLTLEGNVSDGRFESPVVPVILDLVGADRARETWLELEPTGEFECSFVYRRLENDGLDYMVDITPLDISATLENGQVHANFLEGSIHIGPGRFDLKKIEASVPGPGTMRIDGVVLNEEWIDLDATVEYQFESFPRENLAYFPPPLSNAFKAIDFETVGPLASNTTSVSGRWHPEESIDLPRRYDYSGEITFQNARMVAGTQLEEFHGTSRVTSSSVMNESLTTLSTNLEGSLQGESLQIQKRLVRNPSATLSIDDANMFRASDITGEIAGGWLLGDLEIDLDSYDWLLAMDVEDAKLEEITRSFEEEVASGTFGDLRASFNIEGVIDDTDSKLGRGRIVIQDGKMTDSPLTLSILQLSQLMLPISDSFEYGEIDFSISGDKMHVDELILTSPTIEFTGRGEMSLKDWEIALRLFPKGTIPIVSDLISGVTGTLYAVNVEGTLDAPIANLEPLPLLGDPARIDTETTSTSTKIESEVTDTSKD